MKKKFFLESSSQERARLIKESVNIFLEDDSIETRILATDDFYHDQDLCTLLIHIPQENVKLLFLLELIAKKYGKELKKATRLNNCYLITKFRPSHFWSFVQRQQKYLSLAA